MILPNENDFYSEMEKIISNNKQKKAYDINLIDELHANENAHTRILMKLLEFSRYGNYSILNKFIELLNNKLDAVYRINRFSNPEFWQQWELIDGYICSRTDKKAIIIENKIQWAEDQQNQIERYIDSANNPKFGNIDLNSIYVIYLTDNGIKKASDVSLTDKAKTFLSITDESSGRYIEINYKEDLLPMFKDILTNMDFSKEIYLKSALIQYIDYLDGRFGLREREKEYFASINNDLLSLFQIDKSRIINIKNEAECYFSIMDFENKLKKSSTRYNEFISYFENLRESLYPECKRPGPLKNNFYHYFARNNDNMIYLKPFDSISINWNSYPNVIKFSKIDEPDNWFQVIFPKDNFSDSLDIRIIIPSNKFSGDMDKWEKHANDKLMKKIPYETVYEKVSNPKEFLDYIFEELKH